MSRHDSRDWLGSFIRSRGRWLALFIVFLLISSAVPVLAESPPEEVVVASEQEAEKLPDATDVAEGLQKAKELEVEEQRVRETPQAEREREESQDAYASLTPAQAQNLLQVQFAEQLALVDQDPARALSDAHLDQVLGPNAARVTVGNKTMLVEGTIPVRATDDEGDLAKVNLDLEQSAEGYVPKNPITEVTLPDNASEPVGLGDEGFAISPVLSEPASPARPLDGEEVQYFETQKDSDLIVSPLATGVELFSLLRSAESPEGLRFEITLPQGAELHADGEGGAEVVREGDRLIRIPAPIAFDAQGANVPVAMQVEGRFLVLSVEHRGKDLAYPLLVDPQAIQENWYDNGNDWYHCGSLWALEPSTSPWIWGTNNGGRFWAGTKPIGSKPGLSERGLFISATELGSSQPANQFGQFTLTAPGNDSYFGAVLINPFWRWDQGCGYQTYSEPHDYSGLWNETWGWATFHSNWARVYGYGIETPFEQLKGTENEWRAKTGHVLVIGMGTGNGAGKIPCWRDLYAGGVNLWMDDWYAPNLTSVTGIPTGWIKKDNTQRTINVAAYDEGLGVQRVRLLSPGGKEWNWNQPWCSGTFANRCEMSRSGQITFETSGFPFEGDKVPVGVQALDPTEKGYNPSEYTMKLDGTSPTISLSGQLANATSESGEKEKPQGEGSDELSLPTYKLTIEAKDGSESEPRSGVKEVKVYLDSKGTPEEAKSQSCPQGSCPITMSYTLKLPGLAEGKHTLKVVAVDQVGNETKPERKIEFEYIPATGMKEEYVLQHFALPDGHDYSEEPESHGPELAVNVTNGNLVYHERDVQVQTPRASLEVERIYNSQLPAEKDTQWGHGWTLAQTPELKPQQGESPPQKATIVRTSAITNAVNIPTSESQQTFSSRLHATIDKTAGGSYEVSNETRNQMSIFNANGRIEETRFTSEPLASESQGSSPPTTPTYVSSFGTSGTGNGQFNHPAGSAVDAKGNIWVVDENNKRVEKFNEAGEYQSSFGSSGTGNGQFSRPTDVAIMASGNLWVTDAGNNRLQKFNEKGEYITKVGTSGSGNLQFNGPESLAIDPNGNIWVGDTYNHRVQELNEKGEFVRAFGTNGSGQGQIVESTGIAIGPNNTVWVADWGNQRIEEFTETGTFVRQFGTEGTGNGQFKRPDVIEVDAKGNVWVGDQNNGRIQEFNQNGEYVGQFGIAGSGAGQFSFGWPMGIASDSKGRLWISDTGNNRVQKWQIPGLETGETTPYNPAPSIKYTYSGTSLTKMALNEPAISNDPSVSVGVTGGLTSSVSGEAAGSTTYSYESGKLTTEHDPEGETKYTYDASGRLNRVELPNGTWAAIVYDAMSRVTEVTVNPAGETAKTTHFWYGEQPRETKVWGGGNPEITYSISEDGSVFNWSYSEAPPAIDSISGSLWANRNSTTPIENKDHTLFVTGSSQHEIASIQVLVNGNAIVAEITCEDKSTPPAHNCEHVTLEWVTNAAEHTAGQLNLEVVVTDFLGHQTAERFFVTIPQQPPPNPEAPPRPSFNQNRQFREEFGLDREHNYTEQQMTALILELLYEWELQRPTAVLAVEKWGAPMRSPEVEELEYREQYIEQFAEMIPEWVQEHAPSTYGGYYVDNRAGGIIYVGFTANQQEQVESLKQAAGLIAPGQIREYPTPPTTAIVSVEATEESVTEYLAQNETMMEATTTVGTEPGSAIIRVGSTNPQMVQEYLTAHFGTNGQIQTFLDQQAPQPTYSRYTTNGPINPGDAIMTTPSSCSAGLCWENCTSNFGARAVIEHRQGKAIYAMFTLTAGHCGPNMELMNRVTSPKENDASVAKNLGKVRRYLWGAPKDRGVTDAEAIRVDPDIVSSNVYYGNPHSLLPMRGLMRARVGTTLCWSGRNGGVNCGPARRVTWVKYEKRWTRQVEVRGGVASGDSGGPVWNPRTQKAVGIITSNWGDAKHSCHTLPNGARYCELGGITPLMAYAGRTYPSDVLLGMGLELVRGDF
jgi:YD repeat-containing protein